MVSQASALAATLDALELGPEHSALVAYCEGLAEVLDASPTSATLWREYRPALEMLLAAGEVSEDDGQASFLRVLSTPMGDSPEAGKADARSGGRGDRGEVPPAVDAVAAKGRGRRPRASA